MNPSTKSPSRRSFLKGAGLLSIGFCLAPGILRNAVGQNLPGSLRRESRIDSWIQIDADGAVRVLTGKLELGQGIRIAIAQVAGEELGIDPSEIEVHLAETDVTPNEGYTAGSRSVEHSAVAVRYAAASAGAILRRRAAERLGVDGGRLRLEGGRVTHMASGRGVGFGELLDGAQISEEADPQAKLTPLSERRWVGKAVARQDIGRMVRGQQVYVQDLRFPGMVHARVVRPPRYGSRLIGFYEAALRENVSGVLATHVDGSFLAVIAEEEHQAEQAQFFLRENSQWTDSSLPRPTGPLKAYLKSQTVRSQRVAGSELSFGSGSHRAAYFKPYLMHGSIGPSCALARFEDGEMRVWTHSQGVYPLRESLSPLLKIPTNRIRVTGVPGSGCYGHNGADDVAADAALLAKAFPGRHVRVQWDRQDEHGWEPYGSAMVMELEASLDSSGRIDQWNYELWSDTHSVRPGGDAANLLAAQYLKDPYAAPQGGYFGGAYRNADPAYRIPRLSIMAHKFNGPLRVSALRSLGAFANIFAIESFMDELADRAGQDPVEFRLRHLTDARSRAVLEAARKQAESAGPVAKGEGIGYGFSQYKNSAAYCAVAAKVGKDERGRPKVLQMWAAIDAGEVINPDGLANQTEGGMIQSASWTLKEQVVFDESGIVSRDWASYPIFEYADVPEVAVEVIDRPEEPPLGAGEAAQGPAAAAIVNAWLRASGQRVRDLPLLSNLGRGSGLA